MSAVIERQQTLPGVPEQTAVTPMQLLQLAMSQGADLDRLEKLMQLQERWEANQARKAFEAAMADAKALIKPIVKNREVDFTSARGRTNYEYEDYAAIAEEVDPILARFGLNCRHRPKQDAKNLTIICKIAHRDGHFEETELTAPYDESGNKNAIQSIGSTATYLQRYTLKLALGIAVSKDTDGRKVGQADDAFISEKQVGDLEALITEVGANKANFLKVCKVESLEALPASKYSEAVKRLEEKRKQP